MREKLSSPEVIASLLGVAGTFLVGLILSFVEGRIGIGIIIAVIATLLLIVLLFLLYKRIGLQKTAIIFSVMLVLGFFGFLAFNPRESELASSNTTIKWDGTSLWVADHDGNVLNYDRSGVRLHRMAVPFFGTLIDVECTAGEVWVLNIFGDITRYDADFKTIESFNLKSCGLEFPFEASLHWDGESLWISARNHNQIKQCQPVD